MRSWNVTESSSVSCRPSSRPRPTPCSRRLLSTPSLTVKTLSTETTLIFRSLLPPLRLAFWNATYCYNSAHFLYHLAQKRLWYVITPVFGTGAVAVIVLQFFSNITIIEIIFLWFVICLSMFRDSSFQFFATCRTWTTPTSREASTRWEKKPSTIRSVWWILL